MTMPEEKRWWVFPAEKTRGLDALIKELTSENVGLLALEAAEDLGDPRLKPALMILKEEWGNDADTHLDRLNHAIASCLKGERSRA